MIVGPVENYKTIEEGSIYYDSENEMDPYNFTKMKSGQTGSESCKRT